jgi:hypothetical protein
MPVLPVSITPGVTTGHDPHHEALNARYNALNGCHVWVPEGATEAEVQAGLAEVHANGGGVLELMGQSYDLSDPVSLLIELPTVSIWCQGSGATVLNYSGDGVCIKVEPDPFTVTQMGELRGFTIDGIDAGDGAIGIHQINTGTTMAVPDVVVQNFDGVGSVGHCIQNDGTPSWNERGAGSRHHLSHNTVAMQLIGDGLQNSHFYHRWGDLRINCGEDQIGIQTKGTALLQGGEWHVVFNADGDDAVFFDLADTSAWGGLVWASGEQTTGTGSIGRRIAAGAVWAASGTCAFNGAMAPDEVDGSFWPPHEVTQGGHILSLFPDPPSVAAGAGAGASPPAPTMSTDPTSTDTKGIILGGTGASGTAVGELFIVTFAHPYPKVPAVVVTPFGIQAGYMRHFLSAVSETGFTIAVADVPPTGLGAFDLGFTYQVIG